MKKLVTLALVLAMVAMAACASATTVGICQLVQHEALDEAGVPSCSIPPFLCRGNGPSSQSPHDQTSRSSPTNQSNFELLDSEYANDIMLYV